jgi:hypothetical protein
MQAQYQASVVLLLLLLLPFMLLPFISIAAVTNALAADAKLY